MPIFTVVRLSITSLCVMLVIRAGNNRVIDNFHVKKGILRHLFKCLIHCMELLSCLFFVEYSLMM